MERLVEIKNISKYYSSGGKVMPVLQNVSLQFENNEFVAIKGESGSGKTTLLNILAGIIEADDGDVFYSGEKITEFDSRQKEDFLKYKIGYIYQDNKLISYYTVKQNIMSSLVLNGIDKTEAKRRAEKVIEQVGLSNLQNSRVNKLSAGQKQRVAIARVLAKETEIIFADEPTANLDEENSREIMELLKEMSKTHLIIMVSHSDEEMKRYAGRIITIADMGIESDIQIPENQVEIKQEKNQKTNEICNRQSNIVLPFVKWELGTHIGWKISLLFFISVFGIMSLVFGNMILSNIDKVIGRDYNSSAFSDVNDKRIIVRRKDNKKMNKSDIEYFRSIKYVNSVEKYDTGLDTYYYFVEGKDYALDVFEQYRGAIFLGGTKKVRSLSSINKDDIVKGKYPVKRTEAVISSNDKKLLGKTFTIYFMGKNNMGIYYFVQMVKFTGLVGGNTGQIYFANEFCDMVSGCYNSQIEVWLKYFLKSNIDAEKVSKLNMKCNLIINDDLRDDEIVYSQVFADYVEKGLPEGTCYLECKYKDGARILKKTEKKMNIHRKEYKSRKKFYYYTYTGNVKLDTYDSQPDSTVPFIEVNSKVFKELVGEGTKQTSVLIDDYVDTDYVIDAIEGDDKYIAMSAYRVSMNRKNEKKEANRKQILSVSIIGYSLLFFGTIIIISLIFNLHRRNYKVMSYLGMNYREFWKILLSQLLVYSGIIFAVGYIILIILGNISDVRIYKYMKYFNLKGYICIALFYWMTFIITGILYGNILKRRIFMKGEKKHA